MSVDSAQQCLDKAKYELKQRNFVKAKKWCERSIKYFPTREAQALLPQISLLIQKQQKQEQQRRRQQRARPPPQNFSAQQPEAKSNYPPEIKKVLNTKDYYELLGMPRDFRDEKALKKSYRKLAMKYHPDRNQMEGAEDAFKHISRAHEVLSDPEKRSLYDRHGTDAPEFQNHHRHFQEMHPDDILNMFFGGPGGFHRGGFHGGFGGSRARHRRGGRQQQNQQQEDSPLAKLVGFLPIFLILLYSMLSNSTDPDPFSLHRTQDFTVKRTHSTVDVEYFVDRSFQRIAQYRPNYVRNIEDKVEGMYLSKLNTACTQEKRNKAAKIKKASRARGAEMAGELKRAHDHPTPNCDLLDEFFDGRT